MSNSETPQNGATKRWINNYRRPLEPMIVEAIRMTGRTPKTKEDRALHRILTDRARRAGSRGLILLVLWQLNRVDNPDELEMFYRALRPYVAHVPKCAALLDEIYAEMWHHCQVPRESALGLTIRPVRQPRDQSAAVLNTVGVTGTPDAR
ncbi:hypothetical protein KBX71_12055 [Micromonospora sp. D93]|uniref:hypothetical protein n=1 Tax=Micromonospora sp. D93 TaxID=2824886 RepID=UPI001B35B0BC|nr:hypothetical protein [Micromonospora sp. D93]MBQ1018590.1 hypothetical protein [Micromonospora sp. D93]